MKRLTANKNKRHAIMNVEKNARKPMADGSSILSIVYAEAKEDKKARNVADNAFALVVILQ